MDAEGTVEGIELTATGLGKFSVEHLAPKVPQADLLIYINKYCFCFVFGATTSFLLEYDVLLTRVGSYTKSLSSLKTACYLIHFGSSIVALLLAQYLLT